MEKPVQPKLNLNFLPEKNPEIVFDFNQELSNMIGRSISDVEERICLKFEEFRSRLQMQNPEFGHLDKLESLKLMIHDDEEDGSSYFFKFEEEKYSATELAENIQHNNNLRRENAKNHQRYIGQLNQYNNWLENKERKDKKLAEKIEELQTEFRSHKKFFKDNLPDVNPTRHIRMKYVETQIKKMKKDGIVPFKIHATHIVETTFCKRCGLSFEHKNIQKNCFKKWT